MKRTLVANHKMQRGYVYYRTEPFGRNFAPGFEPQLTPKQMLTPGVFEGKYMTDCRGEFPASWFAGARLCAERSDPRLNYFGVTRHSRSLSGDGTAGLIRRIRADGFNGTAAITWGGGRGTAAANSDRQSCIGHMTAARSDRSMDDDAGVRHPIRIGISSCLLGQAVRFDGGHKRDSFLTGTFGAFVEWVPVCPEVECGFGTPRESMRLVRVERDVRLLTVRTAVDLTDRMAAYARRRVAALDAEELCGYVLKKDSPSCGMARVKIYGTGGVPEKSGRGIFAAGLVERFVSLPVEDEGRLADPRLRENFVERVFAYWRLPLVQRPLEPGCARGLPHRAQVDSDVAFTRGLPAVGASRGAGAGG